MKYLYAFCFMLAAIVVPSQTPKYLVSQSTYTSKQLKMIESINGIMKRFESEAKRRQKEVDSLIQKRKKQ